eukprot:TRINITY_DN109804_c0_g1_i1.p1 TRINITY_DN109804_c0_g1~~TRINITY_DN109804_c0_g1_i1.p1  ORF type:complete len:507 (-),score=109.27 TRINITY_DN109804_c0_g1_i1:107-1627(-)
MAGCCEGPARLCASLVTRLRRRPAVEHTSLREEPLCPSSSSTSLLSTFCDEAVGGGASLASLYSYLSLCEALLLLRPCSRAVAAAAKACPRLQSPLCLEPQDVEDLLSIFKPSQGVCSREAIATASSQAANIAKVGVLLRAAQSVVVRASSSSKGWGARGRLRRLALPFGLPNTAIRAWARAGLLLDLEELHLLGKGGPSDAGLTYIARCCPKLCRLTILGGSSSAAAALLLQAQSMGAMSSDWWRGFRCTRLCILPRLQQTLQRNLRVQRVPAWFCGQWSPIMPTWGHEVHYYDALGRFVCLRNGVVERVGVVRSLLPSQFGPWWELDVSFLARQDSPSQLVLILPVGPSSEMNSGLESWAGMPKEPSSIVRGAMIGPSDVVRDRPRKFPHPGHGHEWRRVSRDCNLERILPWGIQEWVEAAISAGADDSVTMFFEGASSSDDCEEEGLGVMKSMEELLAQLDMDEARDWEAIRPSARMEVGAYVPSIEELLVQLDAEEERDRTE